MSSNFRDTKIIPVTYEIKKYLEDTEITEKDKERFSKLIDNSKYCLKKVKNGFIIFDSTDDKFYLDNINKINKKIESYKLIANRLNKSYIWVYQMIVLDGYGEFVDSNSDIYIASFLAYQDVKDLSLSDDEYMFNFEKNFILNGHLYDSEVKYSNNYKKLIK